MHQDRDIHNEQLKIYCNVEKSEFHFVSTILSIVLLLTTDIDIFLRLFTQTLIKRKMLQILGSNHYVGFKSKADHCAMSAFMI